MGPRSLIISYANGLIRQDYVGTPSLPVFHHQHQNPKLNIASLLIQHLQAKDTAAFISRRQGLVKTFMMIFFEFPLHCGVFQIPVLLAAATLCRGGGRNQVTI